MLAAVAMLPWKGDGWVCLDVIGGVVYCQRLSLERRSLLLWKQLTSTSYAPK